MSQQSTDADAANEFLGFATSDMVSAVVVVGDAGYAVRVSRSALQQRFPGKAVELDVEALHLILNEYFGITPDDVTAQKNLRYHRYAKDAVQDVRLGGAQAAFLIPPVSIDTIRDRSLRGALMPQKSTDFYPKMNSGLTLYSWDESFETPTLARPARVGHPLPENV